MMMMMMMIYRVVPFPTTFSSVTHNLDFKVTVLCYAWLVFMQLTRDLFAIAKFLYNAPFPTAAGHNKTY